MITFLITNWKYIIIGVLVLALSGIFALYKVTAANLNATRSELAACQDANISMSKTLAALQAIQTSDQKTCDKRIKEKDATISLIQKQCGGAAHETMAGVTNDNMLDALNRMWQ